MSVLKSVCTIRIVKELEKPDPLFFRDLKWGTWFCTETPTNRYAPLVWVKRRREGYSFAPDNAWAPSDGSSIRFEDNEHIAQVFNVKVELVEVPQ